eukprot:365847-Chlamydomonas_euryale.AAC.9
MHSLCECTCQAVRRQAYAFACAPSYVCCLLQAGHITTVQALGYMLWHGGAQPDVMARLQQEQATLPARHGSEITREYAWPVWVSLLLCVAVRLLSNPGQVLS